jgi:hypothetical protein
MTGNLRGSGKDGEHLDDFPLTVSLGEKAPAWGLSRWAGSGLRFVPPDDEGFTLRGDKRRLVYNGRRRSHRFTILGDTAFEYDCILEKEPESNVITLLMEGAEWFDFFRQPDFLKDPFLKGSYAVYKKETLVGEGTGKLCHIHRPEIIDSRGRRCWGDLSVAGNRLCITIPENWLSEAKYPVVVDPTIGTTTVGSLEKWYDPYNGDTDDELNWRPLWFEVCIAVNKFLVSQTISGDCTAYVYINDGFSGDGNNPVIYSDNGNKPLNRLTKNEGHIDCGVTARKPKGWRTAPFTVKNSIPSGSNIWFGVFSSYWETRFDYGQLIYSEEYDYQNDDRIPDIYPQEGLGWYASHPQEVEQFYNYKVSWYFTYTAAQNYVRTLTQGVTLTDSRKLTGVYKRSAIQTVKGTTTLGRFEGFIRSLVQTAKNTMTLKASPTLIRKLIQQAGASDTAGRFLSMLRKPAQTAGASSGTQRLTQAKRFIADTGKPGTEIGRKQDFTRNIAHTGSAGTEVLKRTDYVKRFEETAGSTARTGTVRKLVLRLVELVAGLYELQAGTGFSRSVADTVKNSSVMGGMVTFFRILSGHAGSGDRTSSFITRMRVIQDTGTVGDDLGHTADYLRGLFVEAGTMAETTHRAEYHRKQQDTAYSEAVPLRHLFIFIRLLTGAYIRDFIIGRFLKSREEIIIKSPVCREMILESRLH